MGRNHPRDHCQTNQDNVWKTSSTKIFEKEVHSLIIYMYSRGQKFKTTMQRNWHFYSWPTDCIRNQIDCIRLRHSSAYCNHFLFACQAVNAISCLIFGCLRVFENLWKWVKKSTLSDVERAQIMALHKEGYSERSNSVRVKRSKNAVHNAVVKFQKSRTYSDAKRWSGRPRKTQQSKQKKKQHTEPEWQAFIHINRISISSNKPNYTKQNLTAKI